VRSERGVWGFLREKGEGGWKGAVGQAVQSDRNVVHHKVYFVN